MFAGIIVPSILGNLNRDLDRLILRIKVFASLIRKYSIIAEAPSELPASINFLMAG